MRNGELKHIFDILENAFNHLGIDYYLIGALARQVWYDRGDIDYRTTKDVDYAALIGSHEQYELVKEHLKEMYGFVEHSGNAFVMLAPDGTQVDILPFGAIEYEGKVDVNGQGMTSIRVDGMKEVYETGTEEVEFETGNVFKVATLAGIALLKFIAYDDRPDQRQKDVVDITNLLAHYFRLNEDLIYNEHYDLFDPEQAYELEDVSAAVLGREIRKITNKNNDLHVRLVAIISKHLELNEKSPFIRIMVQTSDTNVDMMVGRLRKILFGLTEEHL